MTDTGPSGGRTVFLKWFPYDKRNETISAALGADCLFVCSSAKRTAWNAPLRYLFQGFKTLTLLFASRPDTVLVTNPPVFASATVAFYCACSGSRYLMDSHTGAMALKWRLFQPLHRLVARRASLVIVTNAAFEAIYRSWGARTRIIPDVVMEIPQCNRVELGAGFHVAVICSFDPDEPVAEMLAAAALVREVSFFVTGNCCRLGRKILEQKPGNVTFTGFLPDQEYFDLLHACDAVMVLVDREDTMQQGAYEAVSIEKPMILSDWRLLRESYGCGAVYVSNNPSSIAAGVRLMVEHHAEFRAGVAQLRRERAQVWEGNVNFLAALCRLAPASRLGSGS